MSSTQCGGTASCTMANLHSTREAALSVYDYLVNHPDEIPDAINGDDDMDSDATIDYLEGYLDCQSDGKLVISYDTEEHNCDPMVFDFLANHFACLQSSWFMTVHWWVSNSKSGTDCGTDYYDRQNKIINIPEILNVYFAGKS